MQSVRPALILARRRLLLVHPLRAPRPVRGPGDDPGGRARHRVGWHICDSACTASDLRSVHVETQAAPQGRRRRAARRRGPTSSPGWGPGYYLETGVVLEPLGELFADLKGSAGWRSSRTRGGSHTSRGWKDRDRNRALSASDTLALDDGPEVEVKDVRLHLRVSPAPAEKSAQETEKAAAGSEERVARPPATPGSRRGTRSRRGSRAGRPGRRPCGCARSRRRSSRGPGGSSPDRRRATPPPPSSRNRARSGGRGG